MSFTTNNRQKQLWRSINSEAFHVVWQFWPTTNRCSTVCREVPLKRRDCILLSCLSLYLSLRLSLSWKWNSLCGWRDLEQTPRRLRLVALGRSALWSRKVYEEPVVKCCTHCWGPIKYDCCTQTWDLWVKPPTVVLQHRRTVGSGLLSSPGRSGVPQALQIRLKLLHWRQISAAKDNLCLKQRNLATMKMPIM